MVMNPWQVYKRVLEKPISDVRTAGVCMRENPFYVDTVRRYNAYFCPSGLNCEALPGIIVCTSIRQDSW